MTVVRSFPPQLLLLKTEEVIASAASTESLVTETCKYLFSPSIGLLVGILDIEHRYFLV